MPDPTKPRPALEPTHHRAGIDLVLQAIAELKPDRVVWLGDNFDAEEFGSFRHGLGAVGTSDAALHEQHFIYEQARLAYPDARQHVLEGNHGFRVQRMLEDQARPASGLRRVGEALGALAIPNLLGLDALGVEYHGPYGTPSGDLWLWRDDPRLRTLCTHGRLTGPKPGALVAKLLPQLMHSHWQGHDHKAQWGALTRHDLPGPSRHIYCATPGALCRRDGALGSTKGGGEDWTGALGTITRVRGRAFHAVHPIEMDDHGRVASCIVGDRVLVGDAAGYEQRLHARWPGFGFLPG